MSLLVFLEYLDVFINNLIVENNLLKKVKDVYLLDKKSYDVYYNKDFTDFKHNIFCIDILKQVNTNKEIKLLYYKVCNSKLINNKNDQIFLSYIKENEEIYLKYRDIFESKYINSDSNYKKFSEIMDNNADYLLSFCLNQEIIQEINRFLKSFNLSCEIEKEHAIILEILTRLIVETPKIINDKLLRYNNNFIDLYHQKKVKSKYKVDSMSYVGSFYEYRGFDFVGHATLNDIKNQGTLFFEDLPSENIKKLYVLKSYNELNKIDIPYFKNNISNILLLSLFNKIKFYLYIYKSISDNINIGGKYINKNLLYILNTSIVFIGDKKGFENDYNKDFFKILHDKDFNLIRFYTVDEIIEDRQSSCINQIFKDILKVIKSLDLNYLEENIYNLPTKIEEVINNILNIFTVIKDMVDIKKSDFKIINKLQSIVLNNKKNRNKILFNDLFKSFEIFIKDVSINNNLNIEERKTKESVLNELHKILKTNSTPLKINEIKSLIEIEFYKNNITDFDKFLNDNNKIFDSVLNHNLLNLEGDYNKKIVDFLLYNKFNIFKDELYVNKKNIYNLLFCLFTLIFNSHLLENKIYNNNLIFFDFNFDNSLSNCFYLLNKHKNNSVYHFLLGVSLFPDFNFNSNDNKFKMISSLYVNFYSATFDLTKVNVGAFNVIVNKVNNLDGYMENNFLLELLQVQDKNFKIFIPIILLYIYDKTINKNIKVCIKKHLCNRNYFTSMFINYDYKSLYGLQYIPANYKFELL